MTQPMTMPNAEAKTPPPARLGPLQRLALAFTFTDWAAI